MVTSQEKTESLDANEKKKAAYALNLCAMSISQIIDYNDSYILEQEYDAILNNLNLQNYIKDEALLDIYKRLLETISKCRINEATRQFIEEKYQHRMRDAIWAAVPNLQVILAGGTPVQMAIIAAQQVGIGYMNYRRNKSQYALDKAEDELKVQIWAIEMFHSLRQSLFEAAWKLADKFDYDDVLRLTEKQIREYNDILMDADPYRRFERLDDRSTDFEAFPPFWYYKGNAAKDVFLNTDYKEEFREKFKIEAIDAYQKFYDVHEEFLKEDVFAAACTLEHISLLSVKDNQDEITNLLAKTQKFARNNYDILQMCVPVYTALGRIDEATRILRKLINEQYNLSMNGPLLSRIYYNANKKNEFDVLKARIGEEYVLPWSDDDTIPPRRNTRIRENNEGFFVQDLEILDELSNEELEVLVKLIIDKGKLSETLSKDVSYKLHYPNHKCYVDKIKEELTRFGGNSIKNFFRGKGVSYRKILIDVCKKTKTSYNNKAPIVRIEKALLEKVLVDAWDKMSTEEKEELLRGGAQNFGSDKFTVATLIAIFRAGGFGAYRLTLIIANMIAKAVIGRGLSLATNAALVRSLAIFAGPIGWIATAIWTVVDVAGPAYRVTIPAVIYIAALRQVHQSEQYKNTDF